MSTSNDTNSLKDEIVLVISTAIYNDSTKRQEAMRDFLFISLPHLGEAKIEWIASLIPEAPSSLYDKWFKMFADRLIETIPLNALKELLNGSDENNATLRMVYLMFMESAKMEEQVASDISYWANSLSSKPENKEDQKSIELSAVSALLSAYISNKRSANDK